MMYVNLMTYHDTIMLSGALRDHASSSACEDDMDGLPSLNTAKSEMSKDQERQLMCSLLS